MSEELSKFQQILMWELFAAGGAKLNKDIVPKPDAKDRQVLVKRGFAKVSDFKRTKLIELEDRGWRWIADSEPFPIEESEKRVTSERRLLQSLTRGIKRYAEANGKTIQELFRVKPKVSPDEEQEVVEPKTGKGFSKQGREPRGTERHHLDDEIRAAFFAVAGRPARDNVRLSALRARLNHIDRADLDAALLGMRKAGTANLMNLDNPRDIEAEGDAPLNSGSQTFHVVWIEE